MDTEEMSVGDIEHLKMICSEARKLRLTPIEYMERMRVVMCLLGYSM